MLLCVLCGGIAGAQGEPAGKSTLSVAEIYARATERHNRIASVRVEYDMHSDELFVVPGQQPVGDLDVRYGFGFLGQRRWQRQTFGSPRMEYTTIFDGKNTYRRSRHLEQGFVTDLKLQEGLNANQGDYYAEDVLQIPSCDRSLATFDESWFYPHVLRPLSDDDPELLGARYAVLDNLEAVDGVACHVVEVRYKGALWDKLWVDAARGCVLRKREHYSPNFAESTSSLAMTHEYSNIEKINGVWAARKCVRRTYPPATAPETMRNKPWNETTLVVDTIEINDVEVADIEMEIEAGAAVLTENGLRRVPGDRTVSLRELSDLSLDPYFGAESPPRPRSWRPFAAVAAGVLALGLIGVLLHRRKRRK